MFLGIGRPDASLSVTRPLYSLSQNALVPSFPDGWVGEFPPPFQSTDILSGGALPVTRIQSPKLITTKYETGGSNFFLPQMSIFNKGGVLLSKATMFSEEDAASRCDCSACSNFILAQYHTTSQPPLAQKSGGLSAASPVIFKLLSQPRSSLDIAVRIR